MTDPLAAAGAFGLARIQANLDAAEARFHALEEELDPVLAAPLRRRIRDARRELERLREQKFRLTAEENAPFWRQMLESAEFDPSVHA